MSTWLLYTIFSGIFIGSSFYFRKLAAKDVGSGSAFIIEGIVYGIIMLVFLLLQNNKPGLFNKPLYPTLSAFALFFGSMLLYKALPMGKLSVTTLLYIVLSAGTVILISLVLLKEQLTIKQIAGLVLAAIAVILMRV